MFKLLAIWLLCVTVALGELNFTKLTNDCIKNTLDGAVEQCSITNNYAVYDWREGSSTLRCLIYDGNSIEDGSENFTLKLTPLFDMHYVSICSLV